MKRVTATNNEMLREYDFPHGVRGKSARRHAQGTTPKEVSATVKKTMKEYGKTLRKLA
jgi:hypothetical protein